MDSHTRSRAALVVLLLVASLAVVAFKIKLSTDLSLFLPEPSNRVERLLHHQLDHGASSNLVFIALRGLDSEKLAKVSAALVAELSTTPVFRKVTNRASELDQSGIDFVLDNRYLLSRQNLEKQFSVGGFQSSLQDRLRGLASPQAAFEKRFLRDDPSGEVMALLEDWQGKLSKHKKPEELYGIWFSADHKRTLILAEIGVTVTQLENQIEAIETIQAAFDKTQLPGLEMIMTGPAAFAVESGNDIREDVMLLTWLTVIFVTLFLWAVYRSIGMLLLVFAPLIFGVLAATSGILLVYGQIHGITLAFGITLAGVAVDYPIHLLTGLTRNQQGGGKGIDYVKKIWPTLRLGVLSTVIAYAAFLISGFGGLSQLGLFTIIGLVTAALFSRWVLPHLLSSNAERRSGLLWLHDALNSAAATASKGRILVPMLGAIAIGFMAFSPLPTLHLNVDSLSPIKDSRRAEGKMLRADLGYWYGGRLLVVHAPDKEQVLQKSEQIEPYLDRLIEQGALGGYDMASQFLPSVARQQRNLTVFQEPNQIQQNLIAALQDTPFKKKVFSKFTDAIPGIAASEPIRIDDFLEQDLGKRLSPLIFEFDGGSAGVVLLHDVNDKAQVESVVSQHQEVIYMHLKTAATNLVARSVTRVSYIMLGCILLIYLLLSFSFKSMMRPLRIMVPTFSAAAVTAGLLVVFNCPLSIFHLISLMLVVGLGLDYALFFNRSSRNSKEWSTTFKSLWVCGITTILVFGILVLSQTPPLRAIGMTVGIGATLSIIFAAMWATFENDAKA